MLKSTTFKRRILVTFLIGFGWFQFLLAQENNLTSDIYYYKKTEQNIGIHFFSSENREETRTDKTRVFEQLTSNSASFLYQNRFWNFLDYKQEKFELNLEIGPLWGWGNWVDSTSVQNIEADHKIAGLKMNGSIAYSNRYYWDRKNFTIIDISTYGKYDVFRKKSNGTSIHSDLVSSVYDEAENEMKLRYGFQAKTGWGVGRLNPMNNFMFAEYLSEKYYKGRNFSKAEIIDVADEIGKIKASRNKITGHDLEKEADQLNQFISGKLVLEAMPGLKEDWQFGEFLPRFDGIRVEGGPFFKYFNQEPDFVYGGYIQYENLKYRKHKWNRNLSANLSYNRYKKQDWLLGEIDFGWSYFPDLKNQWNFGLKYIPGLVVNEFVDIQTLSNNFVPYFGYFTQVNSKLRIEAESSLRISSDDQFVLAGPEFSLSVYWSKY